MEEAAYMESVTAAYMDGAVEATGGERIQRREKARHDYEKSGDTRFYGIHRDTDVRDRENE